MGRPTDATLCPALCRTGRQHRHRGQAGSAATLSGRRRPGRRRLGGVLPGRRQTPADRAHRRAACRGPAPGRPARLAVRHLLPGGGRSGRDHCPGLAAATPPQCAGPVGLADRAPAAAARRSPGRPGRRAGRLVGRAECRRALLAHQADRRRLPGRRQPPAGAACAGTPRRPGRQAAGPAHDGLGGQAPPAQRQPPASAAGAAATASGRCACAAHRPALSLLPGACAGPARRRAGRPSRPAAGLAGRMEVRRHPRPIGLRCRRPVAVVAR